MSQVNEMRKQIYIALGLSQKESEIYELLLANGEMAARDLEMKTGFKKNTYALVKQLEKKRLLIKIEKMKRVYYQPAPPENLKYLASVQMKSAKTNLSILLEQLPAMQVMYRESVDRPVIRYVEGEDGLMDMYKEVYGQDIEASYGCLDLSALERAIPKYMNSELIPKRVQSESKAFAVLADDAEGRAVAQKDDEQNRESILVDPTKYPIPAEISVYGDKVVMLSFKKGGVSGVMIDNKDMATSLASIYRLLFDTYKAGIKANS